MRLSILLIVWRMFLRAAHEEGDGDGQERERAGEDDVCGDLDDDIGTIGTMEELDALRSSSGSSSGAGGNDLRFDLAMVGYRGTRGAILSQGKK